MGKLIKEESNQERGVNFQKASCTLDASVKIYSHRVDDTHASSHRILESLSRNGTHGEDNEGAEPGSAKVGTKSSSHRHNIADTIERNLENINSAVVEKVQTADPMFHKMSKAFDEGGAKGMLMVNLRMAPNSSSLVFNLEAINNEPEVQQPQAPPQAEVVDAAVEVATPDTVEAVASLPNDSSIIDISTLILKSGFTYMDLAKMTICPALDEYRKTLGIQDDSTGSVTTEFVTEQLSLVATSEPVVNSSSSPVQQNNDVMDYGDDDNGYGFECYDDNDDDVPVAPQETRKSYTPNRRLSGAPKLDWDELPQTRVPFGGSSEPEVEQLESNIDTGIAGITSNNEYNFFDMNMISKSNAWAGARHWKFATRISSRLAKQDEAKANEIVEETNDDGKEKSAKSQSRIKKKEKSKIDFFDEWVSEDSFVTPSGKSDTTIMTSAAILKNEAASSEGALFLPPDAKLEIRDLCRLFLCNRILVPPSNMENILASKSKNLRQQRFQGIISSSTVGQADIVWGAKMNNQNTNAGFMRPIVAQAYDDYAGGDDDDNDYGEYGNAYDDNCDDNDNAQVLPQEDENGLAINNNNLVQATRKVEKVNIGYATIAKRVNVKKLKTDIWTKIDDECISPSITSENKNPNEIDINMNTKSSKQTTKQIEKLSFKEMVTDISENQEQKEVSLSFYFICLLHLANEKTLTIKGTQGMDDLIISKDL
jgi:condensin complex subunit 2